MRIRLNLRSVLVLALLISSTLCRAQTVPGNLTFNFGTTNDGTQLWDLTGTYSVDVTVSTKQGLQVPVSLGFSIQQDAAGNLRGVVGDFQGLTIGDNVALVGVSYTLSGKVTGSAGKAEAKFIVRFNGTASIGGFQDVNFSAVLTVDAVPSSNDGQLEGVAKFSSHFAGGNFEGVTGTISDFAAPLPPGVDGSWTLNLQMIGGNSLAGSATITTGPGEVLGFNVTGPVNASSAVARLSGVRGGIVTQTIGAAGSKILILSDVTFDDFSLGGKVMGQKLVAIPTPPQ
jgi:hypothetical protein